MERNSSSWSWLVTVGQLTHRLAGVDFPLGWLVTGPSSASCWLSAATGLNILRPLTGDCLLNGCSCIKVLAVFSTFLYWIFLNIVAFADWPHTRLFSPCQLLPPLPRIASCPYVVTLLGITATWCYGGSNHRTYHSPTGTPRLWATRTDVHTYARVEERWILDANLHPPKRHCKPNVPEPAGRGRVSRQPWQVGIILSSEM